MFKDKSNFAFQFLIIMAVLFAAFFVNGGKEISLVPVHHDDYTNLSYFISDIYEKSNYIRPISTFLIYSMSYLSNDGYLSLQYLTLCLYILFVIYFLARLIGAKINLFVTMMISMLISTLPNLVEYHFYTGLMTNLFSGLFGMMALLVWQKFKGTHYNGLVIILLSLSAFSKEDFILPFIVYVFFSYFFASKTENKDTKFKAHLKAGGTAVFILLISITYNSFMGSAFVSSDTDAYKVSLNIFDIMSGYQFYLMRDEHLLLMLFIYLISSILYSILSPNSKKSILHVLIISISILSLIGPYSLLSNHLTPYYSFMWFVWMSIASCLFVFKGCERLSGKIKYISPFVFIGLIIVYFHLKFYQPRQSIISWYENQQLITLNVLNTVKSFFILRPEAENVYIIDPPSLSPWSHSSGQYLERKLGLINQWTVLVDKSDPFYIIGEKKGNIKVLNIENLDYKEGQFIRFLDNGNGIMTKN